MAAVPSVEVPLRREDNGTLRVGRTRVTLDTVVHVFNQGATPEEIVQRFPTLDLADVYAVATYYLLNRDEVDTYLRQREKEAGQLRQEIETRLGTQAIRERLIARRGAERLNRPGTPAG